MLTRLTKNTTPRSPSSLVARRRLAAFRSGSAPWSFVSLGIFVVVEVQITNL
jgi:hypothetical protein